MLFFSLCVPIFVCDTGRERDSRVEAVDKISVLYFWQSHLAVDEEKRGGEDGEERVIVMELSEVRECWMKWGPEEQRETKVEREKAGGSYMTLQWEKQTEEENRFPLNHVLCCVFPSYCYSINMSAYMPVAESPFSSAHIPESLSLSLLFQWLRGAPVF